MRLDIYPDPGLVRAGRLVAVYMARVAGLDGETVQDVRLAVGESCGRAVAAHQRHGLPEPIAFRFDSSDGLAASVADRVARTSAGGTTTITLHWRAGC
ncbi:MAG: ATP-binding protein [Nocardioidaceae bacterium]|nr:ATP-binding protein [Nocardioidaceae bacterium]MDQ3324384.1 ATP-binding protein [Actinomycetota bacterium]